MTTPIPATRGSVGAQTVYFDELGLADEAGGFHDRRVKAFDMAYLKNAFVLLSHVDQFLCL